MKNIDTVVFDLDGTILNTLDDLAASTNHALLSQGLPPRTTDEVRSFVGNGIRLLIERAVPEGTAPETTDAAFAAFRRHYMLHCADMTRPYDGIPELLAQLHAAGCRLAVVSNKADEAVKALTDRFFPGAFDAVCGEREGVRKKPAPDSVLASLAAVGSTAERSVYVGDSETDYMTAKNVGCPCVLVSWGFRGREALAALGAKLIIDRPSELMSQLEVLDNIVYND